MTTTTTGVEVVYTTYPQAITCILCENYIEVTLGHNRPICSGCIDNLIEEKVKGLLKPAVEKNIPLG